MNILNVTIKELRDLALKNRDYQNILLKCLLDSYRNKYLVEEKIAYSAEGKSALLSMMFIIIGEVQFPEYIINHLKIAGEVGKYDTTPNENFKDVSLEFFNLKINSTKYIDFFYGDSTCHRTSDRISESRKGLSQNRKKQLINYYNNYTFVQVFDELIEHTEKSTYVTDSQRRKKIGALIYAKKLVISEIKHYEIGIYNDDEFESQLEEEFAETNRILNEETIGSETKQIILARVGQGKFRKGVLERNKMCPFTGITDPCLLIASHIKPWKKSNDNEKVDKYNGLALSPTFDHLFDKGFISFTDNKELLVSSLLDNNTCEMLGISEMQLIDNLVLEGNTLGYMKYHRENVFKL